MTTSPSSGHSASPLSLIGLGVTILAVVVRPSLPVTVALLVLGAVLTFGGLWNADRIGPWRLRWPAKVLLVTACLVLIGSAALPALRRVSPPQITAHPPSIALAPAAVPPETAPTAGAAATPPPDLRKSLKPSASGQRQHVVSQAPRPAPPAISQHSEGPNSPNIVGDNNVVTIGAGTPARRFTHAKEASFLGFLKAAGAPSGAISVSCQATGSTEPCDFARDLARVLGAAGWHVTFDGPVMAWGDPKKTIPELYMLANRAAPPPYVEPLRQAFFAVGFPVAVFPQDGDGLQLFVSTQNPPASP